MQHIDYNSSILVALLSGINLACLDMHAVKGTRWRSVESGLPLSLVVFTARSSFSFTLAPFWYKLAPELPLCYRLLTPGCGCCARRCYGVFESVTKNKPNRVFRWSILPRSLHPPPSSSLWSIDRDRPDVPQEQAQCERVAVLMVTAWWRHGVDICLTRATSSSTWDDVKLIYTHGLVDSWFFDKHIQSALCHFLGCLKYCHYDIIYQCLCH